MELSGLDELIAEEAASRPQRSAVSVTEALQAELRERRRERLIAERAERALMRRLNPHAKPIRRHERNAMLLAPFNRPDRTAADTARDVFGSADDLKRIRRVLSPQAVAAGLDDIRGAASVQEFIQHYGAVEYQKLKRGNTLSGIYNTASKLVKRMQEHQQALSDIEELKRQVAELQQQQAQTASRVTALEQGTDNKTRALELYADGMKATAISRELGENINTVKSWLKRHKKASNTIT